MAEWTNTRWRENSKGQPAKNTPNIEGTLEAHEKLFGKGAKVSGGIGITPQFESYDEQAMKVRPKSDTYGQDIRLRESTAMGGERDRIMKTWTTSQDPHARDVAKKHFEAKKK